MACDICGVTGTPLADLLPPYQTDDIKSICPACEAIVNKKKRRLLDVTSKMLGELLKRFMRVRKAEGARS